MQREKVEAMSRMTDYCDICCDECGTWSETTVTTLAKARKVMRPQGWSTTKDEYGKIRDLCAECTAAGNLASKYLQGIEDQRTC